MKDVILCLYDITGNMAQPWIEAGYTAVLVDVQHKPGIEQGGSVIRVGADEGEQGSLVGGIHRRSIARKRRRRPRAPSRLRFGKARNRQKVASGCLAW